MGMIRSVFGTIGREVAQRWLGQPKVMTVVYEDTIQSEPRPILGRLARPTEQPEPPRIESPIEDPIRYKVEPVEVFEGIVVKPTDRMLFLGASGSGKTQMVFHAVRKLHSNYVILDSIGNLKWIQDAIPSTEYYDIDPADYNQVQQICTDLLHKAKRANTTFTVIIDEVSEFNIGFNRAGNSLRTLVRKGRNYGIGWIVTSQRTARLDPLWLTQSKHVFASRFLGENDTKPLSAWSGQPDQFWKQIPVHEFAHFQDGSFRGKYFRLEEDEVRLNPTGED